MKKLWLFILLCLINCDFKLVFAQENNYPIGYFQNPLKIPIELAGNFGELRPNHFHTGLDFKTQQKENLPVHAAATGKVARIAISATGYGNCLYIEHPNGYTTVYAHLNEFSEKIMAYVRSKQYASKKWQQDITIEDTLLEVKQGEFIVNSGNTGGSVAPHLHFEIRKTGTDTVYNPMLFGFNITDNKPPNLYQIAIYNADFSIYMQAPIVINVLQKSPNEYYVAAPIKVPYKKIKIGYTSVDYANNSTNTLGVYKIDLSINNQAQLGIVFNQLQFSTNRCINAYADYKSKQTIGKWFQGLYKLAGNQLDIYNFKNGFDGDIDVSAVPNNIQLQLSDFNDNITIISFSVLNDDSKQMLHDDAKCDQNSIWRAGQIQKISAAGMFFNLTKDALYDDVCPSLQVSRSAKDLGYNVQLHNSSVPLHSYQKLGLKLTQPIPFAWRQKLVLLHAIKGASLPGHAAQTAVAAIFEKGFATANIRTLGHYAIGVDTIGPKIVFNNPNKNYKVGDNITLQIIESLTAVEHMEVFINNEWICFSRKGNNYYYKIDNTIPLGKVSLKVRARDMNQNQTEYEYAVTIID